MKLSRRVLCFLGQHNNNLKFKVDRESESYCLHVCDGCARIKTYKNSKIKRGNLVFEFLEKAELPKDLAKDLKELAKEVKKLDDLVKKGMKK